MGPVEHGERQPVAPGCALSGAQPVEVFTQALAQAAGERAPLRRVGDGGAEACGPDGCAVPGQ